MTGERYPLEAVRSLRAEEEDAGKRALADATRAHVAAAGARERAEDALGAHALETTSVSQDELARDRQGRTVAETLRAQDWLARRRSEEVSLRARVEAARAEERDAAVALEQQRARLAAARAETEAIERHHAQWVADGKKEAEKAEEDEADDRSAHLHRQ